MRPSLTIVCMYVYICIFPPLVSSLFVYTRVYIWEYIPVVFFMEIKD